MGLPPSRPERRRERGFARTETPGQPRDCRGASTSTAGRASTASIGHGELLQLLEERFRLEPPAYGPYLFADLDGTTEEDEQAAIAAGEISATRVEVVGSLP